MRRVKLRWGRRATEAWGSLISGDTSTKGKGGKRTPPPRLIGDEEGGNSLDAEKAFPGGGTFLIRKKGETRKVWKREGKRRRLPGSQIGSLVERKAACSEEGKEFHSTERRRTSPSWGGVQGEGGPVFRRCGITE